MTYRDSLKHLIAELQRQRLNTQQQQAIQQTVKTQLNEQLIDCVKRKLNSQRMIQFLKKL